MLAVLLTFMLNGHGSFSCAPHAVCSTVDVTSFAREPFACDYMNVHGSWYGGGPLLVVPERGGIPNDPHDRHVWISWINPLDAPVRVKVGYFASMVCDG